MIFMCNTWNVFSCSVWNAQHRSTRSDFLQSVFTCMEFSCRLRYRVLTDMLSGTSSRFCLVQMTRLAWLEQVQREGQEEAAPTNSGPGRRSRSSSWANRKRKGEGPGRQVSVAMRMATGTWPCSLIRRYRWGDSSWWICEEWFVFPLVLQWQFVLSKSASSEMFFVLCRSLCFFLLFFEHRNMQINRCYSLFFPPSLLVLSGGFEWGFCWSEKNPGVTVEEQKRERERADIKDTTQTANRVFTNTDWTEQITGRRLQYGLSREGLSKSLWEALELLCHRSYQIPP